MDYFKFYLLFSCIFCFPSCKTCSSRLTQGYVPFSEGWGAPIFSLLHNKLDGKQLIGIIILVMALYLLIFLYNLQKASVNFTF